jgi:CO/xanthine dehydrogenase Mo-binding subunit
MTKFRIGDSNPRVDLSPKCSGQAKYVDDIKMDSMLYGSTVRSPIPRGKILRIDLPDDLGERGFTVVCAADIPGENIVRILNDDQPLLQSERVNHAMEAILLLAHADPEALIKIKEEIHIEVEAEEAVLDLRSSMQSSLQIHRDGNLLKEIHIQKGAAFTHLDSAEVLVEATLETPAQEQAYIETNGIIAWLEDDQICVRGSMQCPYYIHHELCEIFARDEKGIRVVQDVTGGGFGGKEDYPSILAAHAALLALKSGRSVKMVYDRREDMAATTKRHPSLSMVRAAFTKGGLLRALHIDFNLDAGAYTTLSPVVLSRGALHASGPYRCNHIQIDARAWATNTPPHGAFRGFGAPQSCFAIERVMDIAAHKLGMDPSEIRRLNFLKKGDRMATGQLIHEDIDLDGLLNEALELSDYRAKRARYDQRDTGTPRFAPRRGIGLCTFFHGAGFTGSGEKRLQSELSLVLHQNGTITILAASTEMGQGSNTIFTQILSDVLELDAASIFVATPDTNVVPNSGPTVASRTTMVVGSLLRDAGEELLGLLQESQADLLESQGVQAALIAYTSQAEKRVNRKYQHPDWVEWDEDNYKGDAYPTYAWAVYVAETEVDAVTGEMRVLSFHAMQDIGQVVNPRLAEGQVEGGVAQGIGFALLEFVQWDKGRMVNNTLSDYIIPTFQDLPMIQAHFREKPWGYGPKGAKGLGELPMDGSAAAVVSSLDQALGWQALSIPVLPEHILAKLQSEAKS